MFHDSIPSAPFTSTSFLYDNTEVNSPIAADYKNSGIWLPYERTTWNLIKMKRLNFIFVIHYLKLLHWKLPDICIHFINHLALLLSCWTFWQTERSMKRNKGSTLEKFKLADWHSSRCKNSQVTDSSFLLSYLSVRLLLESLTFIPYPLFLFNNLAVNFPCNYIILK